MNKIAHLGLGLVTYIPLAVYILVALFVTRDTSVFADGVVAFVGYFATMMTMFGWIFVIAAAIISITGLVKRENAKLNAATLLICIGWVAAAYWVVTHFA